MWMQGAKFENFTTHVPRAWKKAWRPKKGIIKGTLDGWRPDLHEGKGDSAASTNIIFNCNKI